MSAASDHETFDDACDWSADRAEVRQIVHKEGEARLRAVPLGMIGNNRPSESR